MNRAASRLVPVRPLAGCVVSLWLAAGAAAGEPSHPLAAEFLNDGAVRAALLADGRRLVTAGETAPIAALQEQLGRKLCVHPLPTAETVLDPSAATDGLLIDRLQAATLIVSRIYYCTDCERFEHGTASGFVISPDGLAVTNYHVIESDRDGAEGKKGGDRAGFVAVTRDGRTLPVVEVLAADEASDVALIRLGVPEGVTLAALPLAGRSRVGEEVHCVSHPAGRFFSYSRGVATRRHSVRRRRGRTPRLTVTADYARGSSGAAIVNARGEVVGLVSTTDSVYYSEKGGDQRDLQMVFRDCAPVESLRALFAAPLDPPADGDRVASDAGR